jgi:hypothetical protein
MMARAKTSLARSLGLPGGKAQQAFNASLESLMIYYWAIVDSPEPEKPAKIKKHVSALSAKASALCEQLLELDEQVLRELNSAYLHLAYQESKSKQARDFISLPGEVRPFRELHQILTKELALLSSCASIASNKISEAVRPGPAKDEATSILVTIAVMLCNRAGLSITHEDCNRDPYPDDSDPNADGAVFKGKVHEFTMQVFRAFGVKITPDAAAYRLKSLDKRK